MNEDMNKEDLYELGKFAVSFTKNFRLAFYRFSLSRLKLGMTYFYGNQ